MNFTGHLEKTLHCAARIDTHLRNPAQIDKFTWSFWLFLRHNIALISQAYQAMEIV